jgi:SAM-dependent MidA family methyltransferase
MSAETIIAEVIRKKGPITFKEFMELALYHPQYGYHFTRDVFNEDYIASKFRIYAKGISIAFADMLEKCNGNTIVEFGARGIKLAEQILKRLDVDYIIVERNENIRKRAEERLSSYGRVKFTDEKELVDARIKGIVFSNEFFDALPVHVVIKNRNLREIYVDWKNGKFIEVFGELSGQEIENYFKKLDVELEEGFRAEVNLEAVRYIELFGKILEKGFVFTVDYGFPSEELYTAERRDGTIICHINQTYNYNPYIKVGKQNIMSHINFSALIEYGNDVGLDLTGFTNNLYFLMCTLGKDEMEDFKSADDFKFTAFKMGTPKILIQHKGINRPYLKCLEMTPSFGFWNRYNYQGQLEMDFLEE